ncbi:MAG: rhodanese-like domain-containing protein [Spirulinaceae cyanobacterium]
MFSNPFKILILLSLISVIAVVYYFANPTQSSLVRESTAKFITDHSANLDWENQWIVSGEQAKIIVDQRAVLLDARSFSLLKGKIMGAKQINWQNFSQPSHPHRGKLLEDEQVLTQKLQRLGINQDNPVVVFGNLLKGWGEEGRIVWMLRTMGHNQAVLVDGGYQALLAAGVKLEKVVQSKGNFAVKLRNDWKISKEELKARLPPQDLVIIDTRESREYEGKTPYGEDRGGHIPGAVHLHYKELLGTDGKLLARDKILFMLAAKGIESERLIVSYCTGGVRSAWLTVVLNELGFQAKNYPGSMWEWAALPVDSYPLVTVSP